MITKQLQTSNTSGLTNTKEYIVLHHTGTSSLQSTLRTLTTGKVSCHYVIDTDGSVYQINTDNDVLWHCGESIWDGRVDLNNYSIGIELIGPLPGFTDAQRVSLRRLVVALMQQYHIPASHILRHKDIAPGRKADPDDALWDNQYPNYLAYQHSFDTVQTIVGFYHDLFLREFGEVIDTKRTVIDDIDGVIQRVTQADGTINTAELIYFINIGFERLHKQLSLLEQQQKKVQHMI